MPSVVNGKGNDSQDFYEKFVAVVEKKIRNVDKRKTKITGLLTQQKEGKVLDSDQMAAVSKLPFVESNLEAMRELLPQFRSIITDAEKFNKRALRREETQRKEAEQARVRGTLSTLNILSLLTQDTKEALLAGHNGLTLTEEELSMLDQLYRATDSSSVPWSEVETQLTAASAVIIDLQDAKDKPAFDEVKFSQLNELLERLRTSEVFNPDYVAPVPEVEEVEEVAEPEEEVEEEAPVEVEEVIIEPEESAPTEEETALLNGDVPAEPEEEPIVDFMHDSHLDRSESQLSPLAPEFNPGMSSPEVSEGDAAELPADPEECELFGEETVTPSPEIEVESPAESPAELSENPPVEVDSVAATFGSFSQEETNNDCVTSDPAVMAWSTGPAVEEPVVITPPEPAPVAAEPVAAPAAEEAEPTNPWSKKSTLEWGNTSLPSEPSATSGQVWGTPGALTTSSWANGPAVAQDGDWPAAPTSAAPVAAATAAAPEPVIAEPVMKDQQTQKVFKLLVDEDGFTEQRRRGANKPRVNKPVVDTRGGFRGNSRGRYNNRTRGNDRENRGERREGGDRREGGERGARRGGGNFGARGASRGGSGGFRGERREGGSGYRGRGGRGGSAERGRPAPIPT